MSIWIRKHKLKSLLLILALILVSSDSLQAQPPQASQADKGLAEAQSLLKKGDSEGAVKILEAALVKNPSDSSLNFWLGKAFYSQGRYQSVIGALTPNLSKLPPASPEYRQSVQMLGLSHYLLGHLADAIPYFEKIMAIQPDNAEVSYALGVSYIQTRQPDKSRAIYSKLFGVKADAPAAYLLNAQMLIRQQFEETAVLELQKAIELDPKLPHARFLLGEMAVYKAEIDKGIEYFKQELELNPANGMAYYRLGEAMSRQLKWDEAIPPLQKSIWLNPFFSGPYIVLGKVYLKKQDLGNAEAMLRRSTEMDPRNYGAHYLLAQVLQQAGKPDEAKAEFAIAEKLKGAGEKQP